MLARILSQQIYLRMRIYFAKKILPSANKVGLAIFTRQQKSPSERGGKDEWRKDEKLTFICGYFAICFIFYGWPLLGSCLAARPCKGLKGEKEKKK